MGIRNYKPTSPGRRGMTVLITDDLTKKKPERGLTESLSGSGGRNNLGETTVWHRGGGHKRRYRIVDFKRNKKDVPATVAAIEYDPNRSARLALLNYADGEKRYILCPVGISVGDKVLSGAGADIKPGNALPIRNIPVGTLVHNIELKVGKGGQIARSAGWVARSWPRSGSGLCDAEHLRPCLPADPSPRPSLDEGLDGQASTEQSRRGACSCATSLSQRSQLRQCNTTC